LRPFKRYQMLASDLDGTLLHNDRTISARSIAALRRAQAAGKSILIVSGRPPRFVRPLLLENQLELPFASYNGAAIYAGPEAEQPLYEQPLDKVTALAIIAALRKYQPELNLQLEAGDQMYADRIDAAMAERMRLDYTIRAPHKLGPIEEQLAQDGLSGMKLLTWVGKERLSEAIEYVNALGSGAYATSSGRGLLEIMAAEVDKARAADRWAARQGIAAREVVACGDELNDIPLLKWAGLGVAVANAQPEVLAVADYVTVSNEEDGVAVILEMMID
jgi:Cof subfamily protein (haloacid dehalogenase superfamily)